MPRCNVHLTLPRDVATLREALGKLLGPGSRRAFVNWTMAEKSYSPHWTYGVIGLVPKNPPLRAAPVR